MTRALPVTSLTTIGQEVWSLQRLHFRILENIMASTLNVDDLIQTIQQEIDDIDLSNLTAHTEFRRIEDWSSLYSLILMAITSTEYDVELTGEQVHEIKTVQDLCDVINSHRN